MNDLKASLGKDIAWLYIIHGLNYLVPLLLMPFLARVLGTGGFGSVMIAFSFASIMSIFIEFGFYISGQRDISRCNNNLAAKSKVFSSVLSAKLVLGIAATLIFGTIALFQSSLSQDYRLLLSILLLGNVTGFSMNWYFRGVGRIAFSAVLEVTAKVLGAILVLLMIKAPDDGWKYLMSLGVSQGVVLFISFFFLEKGLKLNPSIRCAVIGIKAGFPIFILHSIGSVFTVGNSFLLGFFVSPEIVAYFSSAEKIARTAAMTLDPIRTAMFPRLSKSITMDLSATRSSTTRVALVMVLIGIFLSLVLVLAAPLIITILFGSAFSPAVACLRILGLLPVVLAVNGSFGFLWILPRGKEKSCIPILSGAIMITIVLSYILAPNFAALGMSWAVLSAEVFVATAFFWIFIRDVSA
jgi:polysaccharide transporter, PST family